METLSHITVSELQALLNTTNLPQGIRLTVMFEDDLGNTQAAKRLKTLAAMKKLKGSGNGNLVKALLQDRAKDKQL